MLSSLAREMGLHGFQPWPTDRAVGNFDPHRICEHTPDETYTKRPCSCGRELWPPRGRGRGESVLSPRRVAAKLRAIEAVDLHCKGWTLQRIARKLGYADASGVWRALQRIRDEEAAWRNYEDRTGHRPYHRHRPTRGEMEAAYEEIAARLQESSPDERSVQAARERLRWLLLNDTTTPKKG